MLEAPETRPPGRFGQEPGRPAPNAGRKYPAEVLDCYRQSGQDEAGTARRRSPSGKRGNIPPVVAKLAAVDGSLQSRPAP
jgi:hypothetical protein